MLVDDRLAIDRVNPYTLTNTFGLPTDGMYKDPLDGTYTTEINESPGDGPDIFPGDTADHFSPLRVNMSGPMFLKTGETGYAPSSMYPARKYQYIDGTTSFIRPDLVGGDRDTYTPGQYIKTPKWDSDKLIMLLAILALVLFVFRKNLK
jgi:hypothetical protein